jgi:ABC-type uncharacterized transport system ATPase subunit
MRVEKGTGAIDVLQGKNMTVVLQARGIVKRFDSLVANDHIDFELRKGELHALLGENGAGKSTLLNVLYGVFKADGGEIYVKAEKALIHSTRDAIVKYGIGKVSQHSDLVPTFTVAENILFRHLPRKHKVFTHRVAMRKKIEELLTVTGYRLNPDAVVEHLSVGEQQNVELLKLLYQDAEIIFLDESSALLAPHEVVNLFTLLKSLTERGRSIVFVTHKLDEALLCDRITVLRNGRVSLTADRDNITHEDLLKAMFRERVEISEAASSVPSESSRPILEVRNLTTGDGKRRSDLDGVSFVLHFGEILGIAGIAGNGQKQLLDVITGFLSPRKGEVFVNGIETTRYGSPHPFRKRNLYAYVPEERRGLGSFLSLAIADNLILGEGRKAFFFPRFLRNARLIRNFAKKLIEEYDVRTTGIHALADSLSGGNLQKLIVAREFSLDTQLILVAQPSHGLDFKTTEFVHARLVDMRAHGKGILLVSKDLDEILKLSDRIAVMFEGRLRILSREETTVDRIGRMMVGLSEDARQ